MNCGLTQLPYIQMLMCVCTSTQALLIPYHLAQLNHCSYSSYIFSAIWSSCFYEACNAFCEFSQDFPFCCNSFPITSATFTSSHQCFHFHVNVNSMQVKIVSLQHSSLSDILALRSTFYTKKDLPLSGFSDLTKMKMHLGF